MNIALMLMMMWAGQTAYDKCAANEYVNAHPDGTYECINPLMTISQRPCVGLELNCDPVGSEHVIEIRTKRKRKLIALLATHSCPDGFTPTSETARPGWYLPRPLVECGKWADVAVSKTLWIDGRRIGTIREVEEK